VKPRKKQMKPHKHAAFIHAWAEGAEIEVAYGVGWQGILEPRWLGGVDYRIKPTPKPDLTRYTCAAPKGSDSFSARQFSLDNLKLTFDSETGKLKAAEVI
jgi:hypothetical protein